MASPIEQAIRQICEEKGLAYESVIDAIQSALSAAYRKDFGNKDQNIEVEFNPEDGSSKIFDVKTVVEDIDPELLEAAEEARRIKAEELAAQIEAAREKGEEIPAVSIEEDDGPRFNPKTEIMLSDAKVLKMSSELEDILRLPLPEPEEFGRMAAMTAKQVITQKLREAEREVVFSEYKEHEGEIVNGTVQRREGRIVLVDLGRTTGIMRSEDQVPGERYNPGDRIKVYVRQVSLTSKGPEILLSRASEDVVRRLFELEIPEVADRVVELKAVAREAGARSKVAVFTSDEQVDPIGACIGQRGSRIQTIIAELGGEKVDIVEWNEDPKTFITNALSPAAVEEVDVDEEEHAVAVKVVGDQLSLAIGKGGQNVRLAARLTGWKINISESGEGADTSEEAVSEPTSEEVPSEATTEQPAVTDETAEVSEETEASKEADENNTEQPEAEAPETPTEDVLEEEKKEDASTPAEPVEENAPEDETEEGGE